MPRINCPNCKKVFVYRKIQDIPHFPFCSERCKLIDLGAWLDERYCIEEPVSPDALSRIEKKRGEHG
ncbi:MAG: DNA gyrase inhibitor YacG [Candidatus Brocadia sp.]|nr:DNA gyrase inhibitor YacG [Candidatus Brocadia sp.]